MLFEKCPILATYSSNFPVFSQDMPLNGLFSSDFAYSVMGWFLAENRIGNAPTDKGGATRIPLNYDDPGMK